jgi:hypothetical protein
MAHLGIIVEEPLAFERLESGLTDSINVRGNVYEKRPVPDGEMVFYDWIIDDHDIIRGLEIHLPPDHPLFQSSIPLTTVSLIEARCFVRLWLGQNRGGKPQGKEAFGDMCFFATSTHRLAVVVGLDSWLSLSQRDSLLGRLFSSQP